MSQMEIDRVLAQIRTIATQVKRPQAKICTAAPLRVDYLALCAVCLRPSTYERRSAR